MFKNVSKIIMLLAALSFLLPSCTAFKKAESPYSGRSSTKKTTKKSTTLRDNVVSYAKKLRGSKYKYAGQSPRGFDCSGFTSYVLSNFDISVPRNSSAQSSTGKKVRVSSAQPGDLVFFSKNGRGKVSHVALVVENRKDGLIVIHSTSSRGVIMENVTSSSYWKPKMMFVRDVIKGQQ